MLLATTLSPTPTMAPLTSSPGCHCCFSLSQTIADLEGQISILHQICHDEDFIDSLVKVGAAAVDYPAPSMLGGPHLIRNSIPATVPSIPFEAKFQPTTLSSAAEGPKDQQFHSYTLSLGSCGQPRQVQEKDILALSL